jgi:putative polyketide hydroxylase
VLQHWINVIFDTDLKLPFLDGRRITSVFVEDINGTFVPREGASRWLMAVQYVPERGEQAEDFTPERCAELIRKGEGRQDIRADIVDVRPWEMSALIANQFSVGRAFLVGDTAHVIPPTGGFGGNTGIQDSHNLAWKLDAVLRGVAGPALLDTYDSERRPIAEGTLAQALARLQSWFKDPTKKLPPAKPIVDDLWVVFGQRCNDGALIPEASSTTQPIFENPRTPSGRPGTRAPHLILTFRGKPISTIDLFDGQWVLVAGPAGGAWVEAAGKVAAAADFSLKCYGLRADGELQDTENRWTSAYGVHESGAVLIRPDSFIAWRAKELVGKPESTLCDVLQKLSFKDPALGERKTFAA